MNAKIMLQSLRILFALSVLNSLNASMLMSVVNFAETCQPPDFPAGGHYTKVMDEVTNENKEKTNQADQSEVYRPGDEITYSCKDGFVLMGNKTRTCKLSGEWAGSPPFCDKPVNVTNALMVSHNAKTVRKIIDENPATCYEWDTRKGDIQIPLNDKLLITAIRIYLYNASSAVLNVTIKRNRKCGTIRDGIGSKRWILLECEDDQTLAEFVQFRDISPKPWRIFLCEVQIFIKEGCETPPNLLLTNGHMEFDRKRANVLCDAGYRAKTDRVVCENNKWIPPNVECIENVCLNLIGNGKLAEGQWEQMDLNLDGRDTPGTKRELKCNLGYTKTGAPEMVTCLENGTWTWTNATCVPEKEKKNARIIVIVSVGVVIGLVLFFLMGLSIYLIRKQRERNVVVVYNASTCGSTNAYSDISFGGYGGPIYETIPEPPSAPRPPYIPPAVSDGYALPQDCQSSTLKSTKSGKLPVDIAFGSLKSSTLYGS